MGILVQQKDGAFLRRVFETQAEKEEALKMFYTKLVEQEKPISRLGHMFGLLTQTKGGVNEGNLSPNEVGARIAACVTMLRDMEADLLYASELTKEVCSGEYEAG